MRVATVRETTDEARDLVLTRDSAGDTLQDFLVLACRRIRVAIFRLHATIRHGVGLTRTPGVAEDTIRVVGRVVRGTCVERAKVGLRFHVVR